MHRFVTLLVIAIFVASCSHGVEAPAVENPSTVCTDDVCVGIPEGWIGEITDTFISLRHEADPDHTGLNVGIVNMQAIVESEGGSWPVPTPEVVRAYWGLLEEAGVGTFERSERVLGGAERSWGTREGAPMWHLLDPTVGRSAIAVEIWGPNDSWETHAAAVFMTLTTNG